MPQVLTTTDAAAARPLHAAGRPVPELHAQIAAVLASRLGPDHAALLARPQRSASGGWSWVSEHAGPALPAAQLPGPARAALEERAQRLVADIRQLAQQMRQDGPASQQVAQMLEAAAQHPPGGSLYSVGGAPVLVLWGHEAGAAAAPAAVTPGPAAAGAAAGAAATAAPRRRAAGWLAALVPLALAAWALTRCAGLPADDPALADRIAQAEERNRALEAQLAGRRSATPERACVVQAPPAPVPAAAPEPRVEAAAKPHCPGQRPAAEVPQFVIVFDASPSMAYSLNASPAQIEQAENAQEQAEAMRAAGLLRGPTPLERIMVEPHRMTPAREAVVALAGRVPADVPIGLVMVDSCTQGARPVGMFAPAKRPALIARLRALRPAAFSEHSGTPLADGVAEGGRLVDGVNRDATMLVVSDGEESCDGDPCAAAAVLARAKPRLRINVLDITGTGAGNCVAAATRGRVLTARNAAEIATRMRQAAQEAMAPAGCASS